MDSKQNDQLFDSMFGKTEPTQETVELGGKTLKIEGYKSIDRRKNYRDRSILTKSGRILNIDTSISRLTETD